MRDTDEDTDQVIKKERRKPRSRPAYAETIAPKVALLYKEIIEIGTHHAENQLRRNRYAANLSDLLPGNDNAADLAADAFLKLLSGERQDWDGNPETLRLAVGSCINSIISGRLKRHDNLFTTPIDDEQLDWKYGDTKRQGRYLEPAEELVNRFCEMKIIRRMMLDKGYDVEAKLLGAMIEHRVYHAELIAKLTGLSMKQVSDAFERLARYVDTDEFAIDLGEASGEIIDSSMLAEIRKRMEDIAGKFTH